MRLAKVIVQLPRGDGNPFCNANSLRLRVGGHDWGHEFLIANLAILFCQQKAS